MAIYYELEKNDRKAIYDVAEKWKNECLLNDKSLIWDGESIWTDENINRFKSIFVENPDVSGENFDSKLKIQLENESEGVYKLAIEIMFVYYLFPYNGSITYKTKMTKLDMIASWKTIEIDHSLPVFKALLDGLGSPGTFYNTSKYLEVSFLVLVAENIKSEHLEKRTSILTNASELKKVAEKVRKSIGKKVQMQHIFLHLLIPEKFERIASWGHKHKIVKSYSDFITDKNITDTDKKLLMIREKLEEKYSGRRIDFYRTPSVEVWKDDEKPDKNSLVDSKPAEINGGTTNISSVNFDVKAIQNDLVFENIELLLSQVMTAIRNGKHIILTGPPGTGKSKLASKICEMYDVQPTMVTAASNWSTYETIGGYRPDREGNLNFEDGIFLKCVKDKESNQLRNNWLIIDEINRADIDKAFGSLFSVLTGDEVTLPFESKTGKTILLRPQGKISTTEPNDYTYIIPNDWRIIATMNTIDKASLYEMSYAFMRRFAFIPVGIPSDITSELTEQYLGVWNMHTYPNVDTITSIWKLINNYRKIGPAIVEDIAKHTQENEDFTSAVILYVLPQFEGLPVNRIKEFIKRLDEETDAIIVRKHLDDFVNDFFDIGAFE